MWMTTYTEYQWPYKIVWVDKKGKGWHPDYNGHSTRKHNVFLMIKDNILYDTEFYIIIMLFWKISLGHRAWHPGKQQLMC